MIGRAYIITDYDKENDIIIYKHDDKYGEISTHEILYGLEKYISNRLNINVTCNVEMVSVECEYDNAHFWTTFDITAYTHDGDSYLKCLARNIISGMGTELFSRKKDRIWN